MNLQIANSKDSKNVLLSKSLAQNRMKRIKSSLMRNSGVEILNYAEKNFLENRDSKGKGRSTESLSDSLPTVYQNNVFDLDKFCLCDLAADLCLSLSLTKIKFSPISCSLISACWHLPR